MKLAIPNTELPPATPLRKAVLGGLAVCAVALLSSWAAPDANAVVSHEYKFKLPLGLDESGISIPPDNPITTQKVELGRVLFFDKRLSNDNTIACANCHLPQFGFTDGQPVATGIKGQKGGRSAPASINRVFSSVQFWDGRAATLEDQSIGPFTNPIEHGFAMSDEDLELAKKNGVVLVGTEFTRLAEQEMGAPGWHAAMVDRLRRAYRIGVAMAFGTDTMFAYRGETRGTLAMQQIDSWVEAGVSPRDTLKAMIPSAVKLLGVDDERGAIRAGQAADIIATPDNPLDNIQTLKRVLFVMKDGVVVRNDGGVTR